jgi:hypothetical protein
MALGMIVGAWAFSRHGWPGVAVMAATVGVLSFLDRAFGAEVGRHLAEWTLRAFQ